ncbi:MAG: DUF3822 family protein [Limnohabitans sp.]|nr:DUF3822 family protein [Limnohabitans sp.]
MHTATTNILEKKYAKLVLQISLTEVSFCIINTLSNKIDSKGNFELKKNATFKEIEEEIISLIKNTPILQSKFDDVLVFHNNNLNTFIPQVLFDENNLSNYLQYNVKVFDNDFITYDEISNYEMNNVYIPYVNLNNSLIDIYGDFNYKHIASVLVKKILDLNKNNDEPMVYAHIQKENFQLIVVKNQKLLLYNSFDYKTKEDFIYHLLFIAEQLQLNPETFQLKLFGSITRENEIFQVTYKYVRNVALFFDHNDLENKFTQEEYLKNFILIHGCE